MKHLIIDALNLIHKSSLYKCKLSQGIDIALMSLIEDIKSYLSTHSSFKVTIVIDGREFDNVSSAHPKITLVYSGTKVNADLIIKKLIDSTTNKKLLQIISSDTEVYNYGKFNSCESISSEEFIAKLNPKKSISSISNKSSKSGSKEKPNRPSRKEIDEFLDLFSN